MELSGGSWIWSASLRYLFTVPFLFLLVLCRGNLTPLLREMKENVVKWLLWSTVGFGLFYAPLCFAAAYGPAWLVAGTWQITIVAGSLLVPLLYKKPDGNKGRRHSLPLQEMAISLVILAGVGLIQSGESGSLEKPALLVGLLPVLLAAFSYPLGNRKMMLLCAGRLDVYQRVLGMTLASIPFWLLLSTYELATAGMPGQGQVLQAFLVAVFSGIIATVLFFYATDRAKGNPKQLAIVEATQAGEVLFTVLGETLFLGAPFPSGWPLAGISVIIVGMILHSINMETSH